MKYIVLKVKIGDSYREMPFIFPDIVVHADFTESIKMHLMRKHAIKEIETVSAGECNFFGDSVNCCGESTTLKIKSRGIIDNDLIAMYNYQHGYIG